MREKKAHNRKWVIKFAVIFFVVLLVLTFFSNTIMNYSLPQVGTQSIQSGNIASRVRGQGVLTAPNPYSVIVNSEKKVKLVAVKEGDSISEGALLVMFEDSDGSEMQAAKKALEDAKEAYDKYVVTNEVSDDMTAKAEAGQSVDYASYKSKLNSASSVVDSLESQSDSLSENVKTIQTQSDSMQSKLDSLQKELEKLQSNETEDLSDAISSKQEEINAKQAELDNITKKLGEANKTLTDTTEKLEKAKETHQKILDEMNSEIELMAIYQEVKDAQSALDKLNQEGTGNKINAPISGVVTCVNVIKGQSVTAGETILTIADEDNGYEATITVTNEQAKRVKAGDTVDIDESWYYNDVSGQVTAIRNNSENPGKTKLIDIKVTGDVAEGTELNFSIGDKSNSFNMVVPNGAIREDNNGKFILIIRQKSSPLGNRYYAKRVDVEVVASDDANSAITGALEGYEYVITTSTKAIKPGDQVRLADD